MLIKYMCELTENNYACITHSSALDGRFCLHNCTVARFLTGIKYIAMVQQPDIFWRYICTYIMKTNSEV